VTFRRKADQVVVREPEANLVGVGELRRLDHHDQLVYLAVDWKTLVPEENSSPELRHNSSRRAFTGNG
jgi:hypothetical protein